MKAQFFLLILIFCIGLWNSFTISNRLETLEAQIEALTTKEISALPSNSEKIEPLGYRSLGEMAQKLRPYLTGGSIQDFARTCAEVDLWILPPESEKEAEDLIEKFLEVLREKIIKEANNLDINSLAATKGEEAERIFAEATALIQLYPVPTTDKNKQAFGAELRRRTEVSRRIKEIQNLRYNYWAISQIEIGYRKFHENSRILKGEEEAQNLVNTIGASLGKIDPGLLSPSTANLYMALLQQTNERITEAHRSRLAQTLNDPYTAKKPLSDF